MADSFGIAFMVATALIVLTLVPAAMLPKRKPPVADEAEVQVTPPVLTH
jgi:hypothetical protein